MFTHMKQISNLASFMHIAIGDRKSFCKRAHLRKMAGIALDEYELLGDPRYRSYISSIDKALKNFEYTSEWADLISALGKLNKAISGTVGTVKTIRKMRSGDLFLEVSSSNQATILAKLQKLAHLDVTVSPHGSLKFSRGVISPADLLNVSSEEILENLQDRKVCGVRRITIRRNGQVLNTKHLILTFSMPDLPQYVKASYLRCPVREYIPNPLRCFYCQRYGHSKNVCRGQPTCSRCGEAGHDSNDRNKKEHCVNCKGEHPAYSRTCPSWKQEKEITTVKIKNKISYPEAQRVVSSRTPISGISYANVAKKKLSGLFYASHR
ncbi:uncharacterized protein TNCT_601281 [Trichonephila clavata]|uniref:DOP1 N-terminal domain-containing protein n=1 Tax=Trichonephila clavata TaxID=2740835 RepID=A0A8X6M2U7_TRICU|nr:uncharacterized protein TNCT_601281 [Trichonephila clavata]